MIVSQTQVIPTTVYAPGMVFELALVLAEELAAEGEGARVGAWLGFVLAGKLSNTKISLGGRDMNQRQLNRPKPASSEVRVRYIKI